MALSIRDSPPMDSSPAPSSPLSSLWSQSPSPPPPEASYPTPPSSQNSNKSSPSPDSLPELMDGQRPAKRRRTEKRGTTNLHLDDLDPLTTPDTNEDLCRLVDAIKNYNKIVVIAGAGISVSAGVPDFRSKTDGLFTTLRKEHKLRGSGKNLFDAGVYRDDTSTENFHQMVRSLSELSQNAKPTPFHHLIARLAQEGRLLRLYTQNVDGIDTNMEPLRTEIPLPAKGPWPRAIQVHGSLEKMECTKCKWISDYDSSLLEGSDPPSCPMCVDIDHARTVVAGKRSHGIGRLRPRMVLYNEHGPDDDAIGRVTAADLKKRPDCILVVGTTLKVPGVRRIAREMCKVVRDRREGLTVWINKDPAPPGVDLENLWDLVVRGPCDEVAHYVNMAKWNDKDIQASTTVVTEEAALEVRRNSYFSVVLNPQSESSLPTESHSHGERASDSNQSPQPQEITIDRPPYSPITPQRFDSPSGSDGSTIRQPNFQPNVSVTKAMVDECLELLRLMRPGMTSVQCEQPCQAPNLGKVYTPVLNPLASSGRKKPSPKPKAVPSGAKKPRQPRKDKGIRRSNVPTKTSIMKSFSVGKTAQAPSTCLDEDSETLKIDSDLENLACKDLENAVKSPRKEPIFGKIPDSDPRTNSVPAVSQAPGRIEQSS